MGDETLEEIGANGVEARIAAAAASSRFAALLGIVACLALAACLALNDARLVKRASEAARLGDQSESLGERLVGLAREADSLVREYGVVAVSGWTPEAGRRYSALMDEIEATVASSPDLSGVPERRFAEVVADVRTLIARTEGALIVAALGYPDDAKLWFTSPTHRTLRAGIGRNVRAAIRSARALGAERRRAIQATRRSVAIAGGMLGALMLIGTVGWALRRSEVAMREAGAELARRAEVCPLTGLANRAGHDVLLAERVAKGRPFALVTLDLDGFKLVNETYGRAAGDRVLRRVAHRLDRFFGSWTEGRGTRGARLGEDEFATVISLTRGEQSPDARGARALAVAADLRAVVTANVPLGEHIARFGASAGIACFPDHASSVEELQDAADLALMRAKESEAGLCLYDPAFDEERRAFNAQKREVARALSADEFEPFLQPVVHLEDGSVASFEMLARWRRGDRVVSPGLFLPAIESAGLLDTLTLVLLGKVLDGAEAWHRTVPVSVNMAACQLRNPVFVERLGILLDRAESLGVAIEVELLEEGVFSDSAATKVGLDALRARGVRLALDDFGVGYSNFAQLGRVAIDKIKIDRSFVMDIEGAASAAVVRSALDISHAVGVATVAEGIEDAATADRLCAMGCTLGQGYHFARPMPLAEAEAMLEARSGARRSGPRLVAARTLALRRVGA